MTQSLADIVRAMDPATLQRYAATLDDDDLALLEQTVADLNDPDGRRVYRQLGYEPICIPRVKTALAAGYANPIEAENAGAEIPAMCGHCPSERFETATEFDVLFGGAAGSSKTLSAVMFMLRCMARWPGFRALLLRQTFDQLDENVYPELRKIDWAAEIGGTWNAGRRQLDIGASSCRFRYMADADDALQRRGGSYQLIVLDERNLLPVGTGDRLRDRLRSADPKIPVIGFRSTANPGGASHGELKSKFVRPDPRMVETRVSKHGDTCTTVRQGLTSFERRFIPAKATDNPYLGDEYFTDILGAIEDPVLRRAMRDGDWDVFVGQYFCFDDETEILTGDGWKRIDAVQVGESVATRAPDGVMTFAPAANVWSYDYDGDLIVHEGKVLNFAVTPNHRMLAKPYRHQAEPFQFVEAGDLHDGMLVPRAASSWLGESDDEIVVDATWLGTDPGEPSSGCWVCGGVARPRSGLCENDYRSWIRLGRPSRSLTRTTLAYLPRAKCPSYTFDSGDWLELLGWWLAEGSVSRSSRGSRYPNRITGFQIAQSFSAEKVERIRDLLARMGLAATFDGRRFRVSSALIGRYFASLGSISEKRIPRDVLACSEKHLLRLFEGLTLGDGHTSATGAILYASVSRQLADDVQELAIRLGRVANIQTNIAPRAEHHSQLYRVSIFRPDWSCGFLRKAPGRRHYEGRVHCVTVEPYGTVMVRRHGQPMWSGNSEFSHDRHVIPRGVVDLDRGWPRYEGIDYGRAAPFCMLRAAIDGEKRCWLYREIYEVGLDEAVQAKMIREDEEAMGDRGAFRAADPSMWGKIGAALPFAETYRREGVTLTKADNDRVAGWSRVHSYLAEAEPCGYHAGLGWETCPRLHIIEGTCPNFERTLPDMIFDPHKVEDAWSGGDDHAPDAFRYLVSNSRLTRGPARISAPGSQHVR